MADITFTNYADYVDAHNYSNVEHTYNLLGGDDYFWGGDVSAVVYGDDGNDQIYAGYAADTLFGNLGNDTIYGRHGADTMYGRGGNDYLFGDDDYEYDAMDGGSGNDTIYASGDKVIAGTGNDYVDVGLTYAGERAEVTLGTGRDALHVEAFRDYCPLSVENRIDVLDFAAGDKLTISAYTSSSPYYLNNAQVMDNLDANNDNWLSKADVKSYDPDDISVHVGRNFLQLDILDTDVFIYGMSKASLDFLA